MLLIDMGFEFAVETVAVHRYSPPSMRVWAQGDGAPVYKPCLWSHIVMAAMTARTGGEGLHVVFFLEGHIVAPGTHCASQRWIVPDGTAVVLLLNLSLKLAYWEDVVVEKTLADRGSGINLGQF